VFVELLAFSDGSDEVRGENDEDARPVWLKGLLSQSQSNDGTTEGVPEITVDETGLPADLAFVVIGVSVSDGDTTKTDFFRYTPSGCGPVASVSPVPYAVLTERTAGLDWYEASEAVLSDDSWQSGDYVLVFLSVQTHPAVSAPSGFTELASQQHSINTDLGVRIYGGFLSSDGQSLTFSWGNTQLFASIGRAFDGVESSSPVEKVNVGKTEEKAGNARDVILGNASGLSTDGIVAGFPFVAHSDPDDTPNSWWTKYLYESQVWAESGSSARTVKTVSATPVPGASKFIPPVFRKDTDSHAVHGTVFLRRSSQTRTAATTDFSSTIAAGIDNPAGHAWIIEQNGSVVQSDAGGVARAEGEGDLPFTLDTPCHVASVGKIFTATAVMRLVEQERVSLDDAVWPHLESRYSSIASGAEVATVRQFLQMRSGLTADIDLYGGFDTEVQDYLDGPLEHEVGAKYDYKNGSLAVMEALIEEVTGEAYDDFVQREIFTGCVENAYSAPPADDSHALAYEHGSTPSGGHDFGKMAFTGVGGWIMSARDVMAFMRSLRTGRVLSPSSFRQMRREELRLILQNRKRGPSYWHNGYLYNGNQGIRSAAVYMPEGYDGVLVANSWSGNRFHTAIVDGFDSNK